MSRTRPASATSARVRRAVDRHFGIDARSLAAFRVGLGLVLIGDLLLRTRNLRTFYADGALPASLLADQFPALARLSLHARSGEVWFQALLFAVAVVGAVALVIGYRTRTATAVSLCLLASLHARNPYVLSGADALLEHLLFWSLFLPLGERWSVDARRRESARERIATVGSVAVLSQVLLVYGVNAVLKLRSDAWMAGDAVAVVLGLDRYTAFVGPFLRQFPALLWLVNWTWVGLLLASPLLVVATGRRRIALVGAFAGMHLGMLATMYLGIFPLVSVVALLPFVPGGVWESLHRGGSLGRLRSKTGRLLSALDGVLPAESLVVLPPAVVRWRGRVARTTAALVLVGLVVFNALAVGVVPVPPASDDGRSPVDDSLSVADASSRWTLFAPHPPAVDRWYVAPGQLENGDRVDAYRRGDLQWERPDHVAGTESTPRMRKYLSNLRRTDELRASFSRHLCAQWNREHDDELASVSVSVMETPRRTAGNDSRERTELVRTTCADGRDSVGARSGATRLDD